MFFGPAVFQAATIFSLTFGHLLATLFALLLIAYVGNSIRKIVEHFSSNPHELSVKNLLIVMIYFQVFAEIATLTDLLEDGQTFTLVVLAFVCTNGVLIGTNTVNKDAFSWPTEPPRNSTSSPSTSCC